MENVEEISVGSSTPEDVGEQFAGSNESHTEESFQVGEPTFHGCLPDDIILIVCEYFFVPPDATRLRKHNPWSNERTKEQKLQERLNRETLRNLCLVSRQLYFLARQVLYRRINITERWPMSANAITKLLIRTLERNSSVIGHCRYLELYQNQLPEWMQFMHRKRESFGNVRQLDAYGPQDHPGFLDTLVSLGNKMPFLRTLRLSDVQFPGPWPETARFLLKFPTLQELGVDWAFYTPEREDVSITMHKRGNAKTIQQELFSDRAANFKTISLYVPQRPWYLPVLRMPKTLEVLNLYSLRVDASPDVSYPRVLWEQFTARASTVKEVCLGGLPDKRRHLREASIPNLSQFHVLQTLRFKYWLQHQSPEVALSAMFEARSLRRIIFEATAFDWTSRHPALVKGDYFTWWQRVIVAAKSRGYPLKRLEVVISRVEDLDHDQNFQGCIDGLKRLIRCARDNKIELMYEPGLDDLEESLAQAFLVE
jgi:hypothetical protein